MYTYILVFSCSGEYVEHRPTRIFRITESFVKTKGSWSKYSKDSFAHIVFAVSYVDVGFHNVDCKECLLIWFSFTGLLMSMVVYFMLLSEKYKSIGKLLKYCFQFIPHFTITYAFARFSYHVLLNNQCRLRSFCNPFSANADVCCCKFLYYLRNFVMLSVSLFFAFN
jgi:hypothetical protein